MRIPSGLPNFLKFATDLADILRECRPAGRKGEGRLMYESHFGLRRRPFRTTPDSEYYYPGTSHEEALARLLQAIDDMEGIALLTGEPGTGKTLLCHRLLERLGPDVTSA